MSDLIMKQVLKNQAAALGKMCALKSEYQQCFFLLPYQISEQPLSHEVVAECPWRVLTGRKGSPLRKVTLFPPQLY